MLKQNPVGQKKMHNVCMKAQTKESKTDGEGGTDFCPNLQQGLQGLRKSIA